MKKRQPKLALAALVLAIGASTALAPAAFCQRASISVDPTSKEIDMKALTSADLKQAIGYAMEHGDLDKKDGQELLDKIADVETLMDQFDFIRDQERRLMSSVSSPFH